MIELGNIGRTSHVENPEIGKFGIKINDYPEAMWDIMALEEKTYKRKSNLGSVGGDWFALFPMNQHIPEESDAVHYMISPHIPHRFSTIETLSVEQLEPGCSYLWDFVDSNEDPICGFNIGRDKKRKTAMSWWNLHFQIETASNRFTTVGGIPKGVREVRPNAMQTALSHYFNNAAVLRGQEARQAAELDGQNGVMSRFPLGGVTFRLDNNLSGVELAIFLKRLDKTYKQFHRDALDPLVENYEEVIKAEGEQAYVLRSPQQIEANLDRMLRERNFNGTTDIVKRAALQVTKHFRPYEPGMLPERRITASPAYSVAIYKDQEGQKKLVFAPSVIRNGGTQEAVGIEVTRNNKPDAAIERRYTAAVNDYELMMARRNGSTSGARIYDTVVFPSSAYDVAA